MKTSIKTIQTNTSKSIDVVNIKTASRIPKNLNWTQQVRWIKQENISTSAFLTTNEHQKQTENEVIAPKYIPTAIQSMNGRRKAIFGENASVNGSDGMPSINGVLVLLHLNQILHLRHPSASVTEKRKACWFVKNWWNWVSGGRWFIYTNTKYKRVKTLVCFLWPYHVS